MKKKLSIILIMLSSLTSASICSSAYEASIAKIESQRDYHYNVYDKYSYSSRFVSDVIHFGDNEYYDNTQMASPSKEPHFILSDMLMIGASLALDGTTGALSAANIIRKEIKISYKEYHLDDYVRIKQILHHSKMQLESNILYDFYEDINEVSDSEHSAGEIDDVLSQIDEQGLICINNSGLSNYDGFIDAVITVFKLRNQDYK